MGRVLTWAAVVSAGLAASAGRQPVVEDPPAASRPAARVRVVEDPPVASRPAAGDVSGQVAPAGKVAAVSAVCRATGKRYKPDVFDKATGKFIFRRLPGDATYDVCITTTAGQDIEGIDLSWHEERMLRLAGLRRKQLGLPPEAAREFSREDAEELLKYVADLKDFTDTRRVLYLRGTPLRATMLVEVMRTRDFYAQRGDEVIWRTELWYFRYRYGGWERLANVERVLERHRISEAKWRQITKVYYPALSAHVDEKGASPPVSFTIPDTLDPARGRLAGTDPKQDTKPIILGLLEQPTTRPDGPESGERPKDQQVGQSGEDGQRPGFRWGQAREDTQHPERGSAPGVTANGERALTDDHR